MKTSSSHSYNTSHVPSRVYSRKGPSEPQVVQTQQTLGQSIKQGFGSLIGWKLGSILFGNPSINTNNIERPYVINTSNSPKDECEEYRKLVDNCLRNVGDWNSNNDCSKFIELLKKCEYNN